MNRAVLPHLRAAGRGLVVWNASSSVAGGAPPCLGPYLAAKAGWMCRRPSMPVAGGLSRRGRP